MMFRKFKGQTLIVYGRNSVEEALEQGLSVAEVIIEKGKEEKFSNLARRLKEKNIKVSYANRNILDRLSETMKHQGIIADMKLPENIMEDGSGFDDWVGFDSILALDGITDTGNLGAITRSALLFGFGAIVLPKDNSARITPQTIKASAGAIYKTKVIYVNNINTLMETLKAEGFGIFGMDGDAQETVENAEFPEKLCFVIGSEREGIRRSVKKICDGLLKIPTTRRIDSLNASVAAAVAMWEVFRRKQK